MSKTHTIITIGRQFGSGGREIGKRLADELGIEFYDKELLSSSSSSMIFLIVASASTKSSCCVFINSYRSERFLKSSIALTFTDPSFRISVFNSWIRLRISAGSVRKKKMQWCIFLRQIRWSRSSIKKHLGKKCPL